MREPCFLGLSSIESAFKKFRRESKRILRDSKVAKEKTYEYAFGELFEKLSFGAELQSPSFIPDQLPILIYQNRLTSINRYTKWNARLQQGISTSESPTAICELIDHLQTIGDTADEDLSKQLRKLVRHYSESVSSRAKAKAQRGTQLECYEKVVRHLMYTYPLTEVYDKLVLLLDDCSYTGCFIGRFFPSSSPRTQLRAMQKTLHDEKLLAQLSWSSPLARVYLLETRVFNTKVKKITPDCDIVIDMLTRSEQGTYLLKSIIRYLPALKITL